MYTRPGLNNTFSIEIYACVNKLPFIFQSLKGRCYGNQFWGQLMGAIGLLTFIRRLAF